MNTDRDKRTGTMNAESRGEKTSQFSTLGGGASGLGSVFLIRGVGLPVGASSLPIRALIRQRVRMVC